MGEVVGDARCLGVQIAAAEFLRGDHFAGRRLHQGRSAEEDRSLIADDHRLVTHRGNVSPTGGAGPEHRSDLRDALGAEVGLVEEDPAEVVAVGEDLVLAREERTAGVDEVDARQPVLAGDLLRSQVLLDGDRVVGPAFHGGVVGHDHAFATGHPADPGDHSRTGTFVVVHAVGRQGRQLEERAARVQ
jgi:hypothetical protein